MIMKIAAQKAKEKKILEARELTFEAGRKILDSIDWTVYKGQRWVLLGANGAGKTSLLSTICAYNTPSSGDMWVDGKKYSTCNWQKMREKIALVGSQVKRRINPDEKVLEVVVSGKFAQINYWGKITRPLIFEAYKKMKELGIGNLVDDRWEYKSQGERQKALIARALMLKPSVVFLDEPCTGLDPVARAKFVEFLDSLAASPKIPAIVMATHYVEEIPPSFSHAIIIKGGKVLVSGEISKVLTSKNLSEAYGAECALSRRNGRYELRIKSLH